MKTILRYTIFLILFTFLIKELKAQVIISGKFINFSGHEEAQYFLPLEEFNNIYYDYRKIEFKNDNSFLIKLPLEEASFINISLPENGGIINLFAKPNDSISLTAIYSQDPSTKKNRLDLLKFTGSNAKGHEYYMKTKASLSQQKLIDSIFNKKEFIDIDEFLENLKSTIYTITSKFNLYEIDGEIDKNYYHHVVNDIVAFNCSQTIMFFESFVLTNKNEKPNKLPGNLGRAFSLNKSLYTATFFEYFKKELYKIYNPEDTGFLTSTYGLMYSEYYFKDMYKGIVEKTNRYDSSFAILKDDYKSYGYMRGRFQEYAWAKSLHWETLIETDKKVLSDYLGLFEKYFPKSLFLPYLKERYSTVLADEESNNALEITFLSYPYKNLFELVTTNFKGKFVFVDLWATWCTPCIQEFAYKNRLNDFLDSNNMVVLYVSIDDNSNSTKWKSFVNSKKLYGYHFNTNAFFLEDLKSLYTDKNITIPRYLLIGKDGKIINSKLPRPSELEKLKTILNRLIR